MLGNEEPLWLEFIIMGIVIVSIFIFFMVIFTIEYFIIIRRFKKIKVTLTESCIIYKNLKKEIKTPYDDIEMLKFPSIKYTGGWVKIIFKGGNIRLTVVLENIGNFLYELKNILDSKGKSHTYKEDNMFSFFKTASLSDESWERLYDNIRFMLATY